MQEKIPQLRFRNDSGEAGMRFQKQSKHGFDMRKYLLFWPALLALLFLTSLPANAGLFDDRFPSPRIMAMGGAGVAVGDGVWSPYYNPAGLSSLEKIQIGGAYQRLYNLKFFKNFFGAAAYPLPQKYGTLSLGVQYFGVDYEGESLSGEYTLSLSHGFYLLKDIHSSLAFGYSLKAYNWDLGTSVGGTELGSTTVMGVDVGFQASVYSRTFVGIYFLNINAPQVGEVAKYDLPQRFVAGVSYQPYDGVTTSLDLNRLAGQERLVPREGIERQFVDTMQALARLPQRSKLAAQVDKLKLTNYAEISDVEKQRLRELLREKLQRDAERSDRHKR